MRKNSNVIDRFWNKVNKTDSCWLWTANTCRNGYGNINVNGVQTKAHRFSLIIHGVAVPNGAIVRHSCDNPSCVRPDHLMVGSQQDNMTDKVNKDRQHKILSRTQVLEIRSLYPSMSLKDISLRYNVTRENIRCIVKRISWKHI